MLADAWGVTYTGAAKRVWVRMELDKGCGHESASGIPATKAAAIAASTETLHVAVVVSDLDGRIVTWNAEAEALLGWSAAQAVGRPLAELVAWPGRPWRCRCRTRWAWAAGAASPDGHRDGDLLPVYISHLRTAGARRTAGRSGSWCPATTATSWPPHPHRSSGSRVGRIKDLLDHDMPLDELLDTVRPDRPAVQRGRRRLCAGTGRGRQPVRRRGGHRGRRRGW